MCQAAWFPWLAGIVEGEGSFTLPKGAGDRRYARVRVSMTDRDVVERCLLVAGVGHVGGPYHSPSDKSHWKSTWAWTVSKREDTQRLLLDLLPWLGERRFARAVEILDYLADQAQLSKG